MPNSGNTQIRTTPGMCMIMNQLQMIWADDHYTSMVCLTRFSDPHTAGGLLFTRDSVNLQYTTTAALLLSIYSKTLTSVSDQVVQCSAASFSPDQISSFATSQVKNRTHILLLLPTRFLVFAGLQYRFSGGLHPGRQSEGHVLHGRLQLQVPKADSPPRLLHPVDQGSPQEGHLQRGLLVMVPDQQLQPQHPCRRHRRRT